MRNPRELADELVALYRESDAAGRQVTFLFSDGRRGHGRLLHLAAKRAKVAVRHEDGSTRIIKRKIERDGVLWLNHEDELEAKMILSLHQQIEEAQRNIPG